MLPMSDFTMLRAAPKTLQVNEPQQGLEERGRGPRERGERESSWWGMGGWSLSWGVALGWKVTIAAPRPPWAAHVFYIGHQEVRTRPWHPGEAPGTRGTPNRPELPPVAARALTSNGELWWPSLIGS